MIEGTVHRVFRSMSTWEEYDKAMNINREQWLDNQYPESRSSRVASHALEKIISEGKNKKNMAEIKKPCDYSSDSPPILMVQYRGNHSQTLAKKVRDITNALIIFTTRKLKTWMPSLKSSFSSELKSKVVNVVGANPSMVARRSDISPQGLRNTEKRIPQLDSI